MHYPKIIGSEVPRLPPNITEDIIKFREKQWETEFKGTFYYREDKEEAISRLYDRFSKDKSSLWFDSYQYQKNKVDYQYIRRDWQNRESKSKTKRYDSPPQSIEIRSKDIQICGLDEDKVGDSLTIAQAKNALNKPKAKSALSKTMNKSYEIDGPNTSSPAGMRMVRINTVAGQEEEVKETQNIAFQDIANSEVTETDRQTNYGFITGETNLSGDMQGHSPPTSELGRRDGDSNPSKTIGSLSESTRTPGNGLNGRHEFRIVENLLSNVFIKLSSFSDGLGRKTMFEVDWDYLNRKWEITHSTLKDVFMEKILAMSLQDQIVNPSEEDNSIKSNQMIIEEELTTILDKSNLLPYLLEKDYEDQENEEEQLESNFFTNSKTQINFQDKFDLCWSKRMHILDFIKPEAVIE